MPYSMLHLFIGARLSDMLSVADAGPFLLGCVAPDAVHLRPDYTSELKRISHFVPDGVAWGDCREEANPVWLENVRGFLRAQPTSAPHRDFFLGYAAHVIADIHNNMTLWTPLRLRAEAEKRPDLLDLYRRESFAVDHALRLRSRRILIQLSGVPAISIPGRIEAGDVDQLRSQLLSDSCAEQHVPDLSTHRCLTEPVVESLIKGAAAFTIQQLQMI